MDYDRLCDYLESKPGAKRDMPFGPDVLVFKVLNKVFALVAWQADPLTISLKVNPLDAEFLRKRYDAIMPGYHLNKKHWNTITLNGSVPDDELLVMIDESYTLVVKGMTRGDQMRLQELGLKDKDEKA